MYNKFIGQYRPNSDTQILKTIVRKEGKAMIAQIIKLLLAVAILVIAFKIN